MKKISQVILFEHFEHWIGNVLSHTKSQYKPALYILPVSILKRSNYVYNLRCQKYPRHFVRILRWIGAIQTKTCLVTFVNKLKMEDHMFPFFPFASSPWRNCSKIEGHHSIEMLHLNFSAMLFNIKWGLFKYQYFCNMFWNYNKKYSCLWTRSDNCWSSAPCMLIPSQSYHIFSPNTF